MRLFLALAAIAGAVLLVYASIVPLIYEPKSWEAAIERFLKTPWLDLDISNRADWVANALVVIPLGFLSMGAVDWRRGSRWPMFLMAVPMVIVLSVLVIGIEFLQVWFPTRTVSQNDIAAGMVGAGLGVLSWMLFGRITLGACEYFLNLPYGAPRIVWLVGAYAVSLLIYSVMPFDLVLTQEEWQEKLSSGRITWLPFGESDWTLRSLLSLFLSAVRVVPIGFAARLKCSPKASILVVVVTAVVLELIQVPVFTRYASMTEVLVGIVGGICGALLVQFIPLGLQLVQKRSLWFCAVLLWSTATVVAFVGQFERVAKNDELRERFDGLWTPPLVRYYYTSEFSAGTNLLGKLILFAGLGFLLAALIHLPVKCKARIVCVGLASLWVLILGTTIELFQVVLVPYIADINDVITYALGACCGAATYGLLFGFGGQPTGSAGEAIRAPT